VEKVGLGYMKVMAGWLKILPKGEKKKKNSTIHSNPTSSCILE